MAENSKIEWTTHTFNPWRGCSKVHEGCTNCYAWRDAKRFPKLRGVWGENGTRVMASADMWRQPLKWNRDAERAGERAMVFCASLADVFEDWQGPILDAKEEVLARCDSCGKIGVDGLLCEHCRKQTPSSPVTLDMLRRDLFILIDRTPWLDWQLVTKRPENVRRMWSDRTTFLGFCPRCSRGTDLMGGHLSERECKAAKERPPFFRENVWVLTSVSNDETLDAMHRELFGCRPLASVLGLSIEPLLAPLKLPAWTLDWVIIGGESGPGARPCDMAWIRSIVEQCKAAGVPCFVKQLGGNPIGVRDAACDACNLGVKRPAKYHGLDCVGQGIRNPKGGDPAEWPEDLRVREMPKGLVLA